jgi:hypothetical protein
MIDHKVSLNIKIVKKSGLFRNMNIHYLDSMEAFECQEEKQPLNLLMMLLMFMVIYMIIH